MRKVVLHYHLFKNAGTSLDELFKEQFPDRWVTREFPAGREENARQLAAWILEEPDAAVFSSHTALLPAPAPAGVIVLPVIFVRHPLDRIASAYSFEHTQQAEGFGATLARNTTLAGYVETRLSIPNDRQCRDFHAERLAGMFPDDGRSEEERALAALDALPFVGLVEDFAGSLDRLQAWLTAEGFSDLDLRPVERNVSRGRSKSLAERVDELVGTLGPDLFERLVEENRADLAVYERVRERYGR